MSAPDSWESLADPNIPPGQGGDMGGRFAQMNINARPFVPNIHAHPFVPVPRYGAPYGYPPMAGNVGVVMTRLYKCTCMYTVI